jgi:two-component system invasion response regulator UvrY
MIRVVVADDHEVVRAGVRRILEEHGDICVVAEATSGNVILTTLAAVPVDVLVLDISMPGPGIFEMLRIIGERHPAVRTVVLTLHPEDQYAVRVLRAGAYAYLSKARPAEFLVEAVRMAGRGKVFVDASVGQTLAAQASGRAEPPSHQQLSDRELDVLTRIARGQSVKTIALELGLSHKTVSTYHSRIREKLQLPSDADLIRYALAQGLVA